MFDHVLSALPAEMVSQVLDVVEVLPAAGQYEFFKNELLNIHQLSDYEKFDALVKMHCYKTLCRILPPRPDGAGLIGLGRGK